MIGDSIERVTKATGIKYAVDSISKKTGKKCNCGKRKEQLNNPNLLVNRILYTKKK
jgi:hypothetical protein